MSDVPRAAAFVKPVRSSRECPYDFTQIKPRECSKSHGSKTTKRMRRTVGGSAGHDEDLAVPDNTDYPTTSNQEAGVAAEPVQVTLTQEQLYVLLLKNQGAIHALDVESTRFTLMDYNVELSALKRRYVLVSRGPASFNGDVTWVYRCSCDSARSDLITCCGSLIASSPQEFNARHPPCIHIAALISILDPVDSINGIQPHIADDDQSDALNEPPAPTLQPSTHLEVEPLGEIHAMWSVKCPLNGYGIVEHLDDEQPRCMSCTGTHCNHTRLYRKWLTGTDEPTQHLLSSHRQIRNACLSGLPIPYNSTAAMRRVYQLPTSDRFPHNNGITLSPTITHCTVCNELLTPHVITDSAYIYLTSQVLSGVTVMYRECTACEKRYHYDGIDDCVLNMGTYIMCHEILRRYLYAFMKGRTTIYTDYETLCDVYSDGGFEPTLTYQQYAHSWYGFLALIDIDYDTGFLCPSCGPVPPTVVMDGTTVSFRKALLSWSSVVQQDASMSGSDLPCDGVQPNRVAGRTLLTKPCRTLLGNYANAQRGIPRESKAELLRLVQVDADVAVASLVSHVFDVGTVASATSDKLFAAREWRPLLLALASSSPLCSFLPPDVHFFSFLLDALNLGMDIFSHDEYLVHIQETVPIIFNLLSSLRHLFPFELFVASMDKLQEKVFYPFSGSSCQFEAPANMCQPYTYFPQWPVVRTRGTYLADRKTVRQGDICTKLAKGHRSLLPGIFTIYCPHGVCYGFDVMVYHESPDTPFTLLRTRFNTPPPLVIYDNACSLHSYALNRDPLHFQGTLFKIDALHFKNHTVCGPSYNLKGYPQHQHLNSQVVEQANSRIQTIKSSLAYMTQEHFIEHCKLFLWGQNQKCIEAMDV